MFSKIARFCKEISQDTLVSKKHHHSYLSAPFFSNVGRAFSSETLEFTVKRQEVIVPSPLSPPHVVALTNNDQIMPPFITGFYYFFQAPPSGPPPSAPLTQSLARALAAFPPAAGRFKPRSNGAGIDVECNNQGALFVEAHTTATLQDLLTTGNGDVRGGKYQPNPLWKSLVPDLQDSKDKPLVLTQLTRLGCGGMVVSVMMHHWLGDGAAKMHFASSWASLTRGKPITAPPHLDRACMQPRTPPRPSFEHREYIVHQTVPQFWSRQPPPMTSRIFEFLPEDIQALQERANGAGLTRFQTLAAHIWKHVTKARGFTDTSVQSKLGFAVCGRMRLNPPLPANYFGNVVFSGATEETVGELMAELGVHKAGERIRSATLRMTDEYLLWTWWPRSAMDLVAAQATPGLVTTSLGSPADLFITSWTNFEAYDVDWGWGPPLFFTPSIPVRVPGFVILFPHVHHRAINVLVTLIPPYMDALLRTRISATFDHKGPRAGTIYAFILGVIMYPEEEQQTIVNQASLPAAS